MKHSLSFPALAVATALCIAPLTGHAAKKPTPLNPTDAASLQGKTAAVSLHKTPSFVAMTAGKAGFGLLGVAGMVKAGNDFVEQNGIEDPAVLLRAQLGAILQDTYGLNVQAVGTTVTDEKKPAKLAKLYPQSDVVLSVRSTGWNYGYYAKAWNEYWVGYSAEVQLIDAKSGKQMSQAVCGANTMANPIKPKLDDLRADRGQLTKDILSGLGWLCVQLLAKEQFMIPADKIPAIPAEYANPLTRLQPAAATAVPATEAAASRPTEPAPEPTIEPAPPVESPATTVPAARTP